MKRVIPGFLTNLWSRGATARETQRIRAKEAAQKAARADQERRRERIQRWKRRMTTPGYDHVKAKRRRRLQKAGRKAARLHQVAKRRRRRERFG